MDIEDCLKEPMAGHIRLIEEMRKLEAAPVDTMGCHMLADRTADPKVFRFQTLVSLLLSSQTKDQANAAAMERLRKRGLTVGNIIDMPESELANILRGVSFHNTKAINMKKVATILKEQYDSDIPSTFEGLCALPGIGPKMAHLTLQNAYDICEGIAVDTHVHRIVNRLRWASTKTPEATSTELCKILPRSHWRTINKLLVGFGQQTCRAIRPKCEECLLKDVCPASEAGKKKSKAKKRGNAVKLAPDEIENKKPNI